MADLVALGGNVFITVFMCAAVIQACRTIRKDG